MVRTHESNCFLVGTKLGYLWYSAFLNVSINRVQKKEKQKEIWL